jgi:hypothetical protein
MVALSGAVVASMASLERGFTLVDHYRNGYVDREVEVISGACTQGAFFGFYQGVGDGSGQGTSPGLILYAFCISW